MPDHPPALDTIHASIIACESCPRLRTYCARVAREKRAAYRHDTYWARPVPGFGDPSARIVLVGLAPAAHGANRTGRLFTGDVPGGSSDFLMAAMHACGLANQPTSRAADDGLVLNDVYVTSAVRCAPPDNKPSPSEIRRCFPYLEAEISALPNAKVFVALGRLAFDAIRKLLKTRGAIEPHRPTFEHGTVFEYGNGWRLVSSYHPSRQNTQTGKLTQAMLREALRKARKAAS